jgi:phospholipid/cholesterol/gamma-HCH transport system permease protein
MVTFYTHIGRYFLLVGRAFAKPERFSVYRKQIMYEVDKIGVQSLGIVALLSLFMGAVITLQTAVNIDSAWIPRYTIGFTTRQTMILEFSPTIISLILAGKVGSNIASEIGTMRVTEQIDALDIMGVNSAAFLIFPKIVASVFILPFLVVISMFLGIGAGAVIGELAGVITYTDYEYGIQYDFRPYHVPYALIKTLFFAFIITTVSSYFGYFTRGGALEVGRSSTQAVVYSIVAIMICNYVLTQILLM